MIYIVAICCCFADGGFVLKPNEHATEPSQRATIFYADGIQDTFLQVSLEGEVSEFGWLVPVPSKPTLEQVEKIPSFYTRDLLATTPVDEIQYLPSFFSYLGGGSVPPGFKMETVNLTDYTAKVIHPEGNGVSQWLRSHDFIVTENAEKIIKEYRRDGWYFCAIKLNASKRKKKHDALLPPIKFSFKTDKPVFPLRISAINDSPSLVEVDFISPELHTPIVKLLPKDIPTEKEAIKYTLFGEDCPNDIVLQPLRPGYIWEDVNIKTFRKNAKSLVYPKLYNFRLKKWYSTEEMTTDIYFKTGTEVMFTELTKQLNLYRDPKKGYKDRYDTMDNEFKTLTIAKEKLSKFKPITPYDNPEKYFTKVMFPSHNSYGNDLDDYFEDDYSDDEKENYTGFFIFSKYDEQKKKIVQTKISKERLIKLTVDSVTQNRWNSELYSLLYDYAEGYYQSTDPHAYRNTGNKDLETYANLDIKDSKVEGKLPSSDKFILYDWNSNFLGISNPFSSSQNSVDSLKKALLLWAPNMEKSANFVDKQKAAIDYLREFTYKDELHHYSKKYRAEPIMYNKRGGYHNFAVTARDDFLDYFYETKLYLRKIVVEYFHDRNDYFYAFGTETGKSLPFNTYFFTLVAHQHESLIPVLIEWLKNDNEKLRHNAIIALAHVSFLALDHVKETQQAVAVYKEELNKLLIPGLTNDPQDNFWVYLLRLNYDLDTNDCSNSYFTVLKMINNNKKFKLLKNDNGETFERGYYEFNSGEIYRLIDKICQQFHSSSSNNNKKFRERIAEYFFEGWEYSSIRPIIELFWAEQALRHQETPTKYPATEAKSILVDFLKKNKLEEQEFTEEWWSGFEKNEIFYATAFVDDPEIREHLFSVNNLNALIHCREHIHEELAEWLERKFTSTNDYKYKVWQKLCINTCTLSPTDFYEFQDYFAKVSSENFTTEKKKKLMSYALIPYQTRKIQFRPELRTVGVTRSENNFYRALDNYHLLIASVYGDYKQLPHSSTLKESEKETKK